MKLRSVSLRTLLAAMMLPGWVAAQSPSETPKPAPGVEESAAPNPSDRLPVSEPVADSARQSQRTSLNLLGQTDTQSGESRRNENVQFNLIDNNALKELNVRLGVSATIVSDYTPGAGYFGAEFGNPAAMPVHLPRAAARDGVHGRLYLTHQNSVFSARSFFQVGEVQPANENDYGFQVGTRLWRGAFLQMAGGQTRSRGQVNGNILVPQPDERTPLATDARTRAIVERFLNAYPAELPNRTDINPRALNTNAPQIIDNDTGLLRLDQRVSERDQLFLRYSFLSQRVDAFQLVAGQNPDTTTKSHQPRATWVRQWSPGRVSEFTFAFDRLGSLLIPEPNAVGPLVSTSNALRSLGPDGNIPIDRAQNTFTTAGQHRQTGGAHTITTGFEVRRLQMNGRETDVHRGFLSFSNDFGRDAITNLRMGTPTGGLISIGEVHRGFRNWAMKFYAADTWRVGSALTLDLGVLYNPITSPVEVNGLNRIPYPCDCNNVAPRTGFAYRLPGRWGVLRGAYGLHYGEIFRVTYSQARFSPPLNNKINVPRPDIFDMAGSADLNDPNIRPVFYTLSPDLRTPYSHLYSTSWERELGSGWFLQAGYVGSRSHKLLLMWYLNRSGDVPGIPRTTGTVNVRRPDDRWADIRLVVNGSRGYYDAGRVTLVVPRWKNLAIDTSYWFSKAIDLGASYTNTAYETDSRLSRSQEELGQHSDMRGLSDFDQPHSFLLRATYSTPALASQSTWLRGAFGSWELSTVTLLKNGTPFTVSSGSDAPPFGNVDANGGDRVDIVDPSILGRTIGNPDTAPALLPRSAFRFMGTEKTRGNIGRNTFRKGSIRNVNASLSRRWALASERYLRFRAESINFLNTPQFAEPGFDLVNPNFGQITNTLNDGRTFRFQLALEF